MMETLGITWAGLYFGLKIFGLATLVGMGVTAGMWVFCKAAKWAPVNLTNNINITSADD